MVSLAIVAVLIILLVFIGLYFLLTNQNLPTTEFQTETTTSETTTTSSTNFLRRTYYINTTSGIGVSRFDNNTLKDVRNGFNAWQLATNSLIQFTEVNYSNASIEVSFVDELNRSTSTITIGETFVRSGLIKGTIQIVPQALSCRNTGIMIHEIGHIIGLEHNQTERSDIMYPLQNLACGQSISSYDAEHAKMLIEDLIS